MIFDIVRIDSTSIMSNDDLEVCCLFRVNLGSRRNLSLSSL